MPIKREKERRNSIKKVLKNQEKTEFLNSLPIPISVLQELFHYLDLKLSKNNCDNSLKFTLEFIEDNYLPENKLIEWFENNGGYCDCEVLANIEEQINDV